MVYSATRFRLRGHALQGPETTFSPQIGPNKLNTIIISEVQHMDQKKESTTLGV